MCKQRKKLEVKYDKIVKDKFGVGCHCLNKVFEPYTFEEGYPEALKIFKYLFAQGEEAQTYLWNKLYSPISHATSPHIKKENFTADELAFLLKIWNTPQDNYDSYTSEHEHVNINDSIATERLTLSPFDMWLDERINRYFVQNKEEFEKYYLEEYDEDDVRDYCHPKLQKLGFAILLKGTNDLIGCVALNQNDSDVLYNLECYVMPEYRKYGYATEAVKALIDCAFDDKLVILQETIRIGVFTEETPNIKCISATISTKNIPALKLVEKFGFELDGILRYERQIRDKYFDLYVYTLEKENFKKKQK